jgi:hypothetical protein
MKISKIVFLFFLITGVHLAGFGQAKTEYPKPKVDNLLFYVQRTINVNTLIYTLNVDEKGVLDTEQPIKIRWINYTKDSSYEDLNYVQKKYAYGIAIKPIDKEKQTFVFNFVSYKKKSIYLSKYKGDNKFHAFYKMNNEMIILERIFIQIEGGSFWFPKIKFIEVSGVNLKNEKVSEKIIP